MSTASTKSSIYRMLFVALVWHSLAASEGEKTNTQPVPLMQFMKEAFTPSMPDLASVITFGGFFLTDTSGEWVKWFPGYKADKNGVNLPVALKLLKRIPTVIQWSMGFYNTVDVLITKSSSNARLMPMVIAKACSTLFLQY